MLPLRSLAGRMAMVSLLHVDIIWPLDGIEYIMTTLSPARKARVDEMSVYENLSLPVRFCTFT